MTGGLVIAESLGARDCVSRAQINSPSAKPLHWAQGTSVLMQWVRLHEAMLLALLAVVSSGLQALRSPHVTAKSSG